jgi:hypothetical protein
MDLVAMFFAMTKNYAEAKEETSGSRRFFYCNLPQCNQRAKARYFALRAALITN